MFILKKIETWNVVRSWRVIGFRNFLSVMVLTALPSVSYSQAEYKSYPVQFSQFIFSYPLINPASLGAGKNNEVLLGYLKPVSGFAGVSTYFCGISVLPYKPKAGSGSRSIIGFRFYNDNEGAYINRKRFYFTYAFHTHLSRGLEISGGIDLGGMNFSIKPTPTTDGASTYNMDANAGMRLFNENFHVGVSVNQLFNSILKPIEEKTRLPLFFNLSSSLTLLSGDIAEISPHLLVTFPYFERTSVRGSLYGLFFNRFIAVIGWNHKTSISYMLGINDLEVLRNALNIIISYNTPMTRASLSINQWEMSVSYSL